MSTNETAIVADHEQWILDYETAPSAPRSYEALIKVYVTKSALIRYLNSEGWSRGAIAKFMDIRYQHVRNVLLNPPKKQ